MKRAIFLATVALLAMLVLVPMAMAQVADDCCPTVTMVSGNPSGVPVTRAHPKIPPSGGPAILLPAAALLLGSGILTYAILRRT